MRHSCFISRLILTPQEFPYWGELLLKISSINEAEQPDRWKAMTGLNDLVRLDGSIDPDNIYA